MLCFVDTGLTFADSVCFEFRFDSYSIPALLALALPNFPSESSLFFDYHEITELIVLFPTIPSSLVPTTR